MERVVLALGSSVVRAISHEASQSCHLVYSGLMELGDEYLRMLRNGGLGEEVLTCGWDSLDRKVTFETCME